MVSVKWLKDRDEKRREAEEALLAAHGEFMSSFRRALCDFLKGAVNAGVSGVRACTKTPGPDGRPEHQFALRDSDMVLVDGPRPNLLDFGGPQAAKSFVYFDGDEDHTPFVEIVTSEDEDSEGYVSWMNWMTDKGRRPLSGLRGSQKPLGSDVMKDFVAHIYRLDHVWLDRPMRRALYGYGNGRAVGFHAEDGRDGGG